MLIPIARKRDDGTIETIRDHIPWWPYEADGTYRLIRLKRLRCVRIGRNMFLTREIVDEFIAKHTES